MRAFDPAAAAAQLQEAQQQQKMQQEAQQQVPTMPRPAPAVSLASPPLPPAKDNNEGPTRRAQAVLDKKPTTRRTSGGLTGQYSTSMPTSGGYFPNMDEPADEAELARRDRQRQREDKRRALKAAWGIDNRKLNRMPS